MVDVRGPLVSHEDANASGDDPAALEALIEELARVVHARDEARLLARNAGFPPGDFPEFTTARIFWSTVIHAVHNGKTVGGVRAVAEAVARQYPANEIFQRYGGRDASARSPEMGGPGATKPWWVAGVFVLLAGVGVLLAVELCGGGSHDDEDGHTEGGEPPGSSTSGTTEHGQPYDGADVGTSGVGSTGGDSSDSGGSKPKPKKHCKVDAEYQDPWQPRCAAGQTVVREVLEGRRLRRYKSDHPKTSSCDTITLYSCR